MELTLLTLPDTIFYLVASYIDIKSLDSLSLCCHQSYDCLNQEDKEYCMALAYSHLSPEKGGDALQNVLNEDCRDHLWVEVKAYCTSLSWLHMNQGIYYQRCEILSLMLRSRDGDEEALLELATFLAREDITLGALEVSLLAELPWILIFSYLSADRFDDPTFLSLLPKLAERGRPMDNLILLWSKSGGVLDPYSLKRLTPITLKVLLATGLKLQADKVHNLHDKVKPFIQQACIGVAVLSNTPDPFRFQYIGEAMDYFSLLAAEQLASKLPQAHNYSALSGLWHGAPYSESQCISRELSITFFQKRRLIKKKGEIHLGDGLKGKIVIPLLFLEGFATMACMILENEGLRRKVLTGPIDLRQCCAPYFLVDPEVERPKISSPLTSVILMGKYRVYLHEQDSNTLSYPGTKGQTANFLAGVQFFCTTFRLKITMPS